MKRIISVALAIFLCASLLSVISFADSAPTMSISNVEAEAGSDVVVEISVTNNPGIGMLKICIGYDSDKLQVAEKAVNTGLIKGLFEQSQTTEKNPYILVWINTTDSTDDGVIATIKFHVLDTAPSCTVPITLGISDAYKVDEERLSFNIEDGSVIIAGTGEENSSDTDMPSDTDTADTDSSVDSDVNDDTSSNNSVGGDATSSDSSSKISDQSFKKESNSVVCFDIPNGKQIKSIAVDGIAIAKNLYVVKDDGDVELSADYLNTLSEGKHKILFIFSDGSDESAILTVTESSGEMPYETIAVAVISILAVICIVIVVIITRKNRKKA